ncbi:hypothetical protein DSECCO2_605790 [anaerobic digester metagenome]
MRVGGDDRCTAPPKFRRAGRWPQALRWRHPDAGHFKEAVHMARIDVHGEKRTARGCVRGRQGDLQVEPVVAWVKIPGCGRGQRPQGFGGGAGQDGCPGLGEARLARAQGQGHRGLGLPGRGPRRCGKGEDCPAWQTAVVKGECGVLQVRGHVLRAEHVGEKVQVGKIRHIGDFQGQGGMVDDAALGDVPPEGFGHGKSSRRGSAVGRFTGSDQEKAAVGPFGETGRCGERVAQIPIGDDFQVSVAEKKKPVHIVAVYFQVSQHAFDGHAVTLDVKGHGCGHGPAASKGEKQDQGRSQGAEISRAKQGGQNSRQYFNAAGREIRIEEKEIDQVPNGNVDLRRQRGGHGQCAGRPYGQGGQGAQTSHEKMVRQTQGGQAAENRRPRLAGLVVHRGKRLEHRGKAGRIEPVASRAIAVDGAHMEQMRRDPGQIGQKDATGGQGGVSQQAHGGRTVGTPQGERPAAHDAPFGAKRGRGQVGGVKHGGIGQDKPGPVAASAGVHGPEQKIQPR